MLGELARLFLRLGATAFGGPAAHIAMMEDEVVRKRGWVTRDELLDLIGACNLIPGPNSTELAIHLGHRRAGWSGLVVAGACFIVPAALLVGTIAWAYVRWGALPEVGAVLSTAFFTSLPNCAWAVAGIHAASATAVVASTSARRAHGFGRAVGSGMALLRMV